MTTRQFNPGAYIAPKLAAQLAGSGPRAGKIVLGIDENLNNAHIAALGRRLLSADIIDRSLPLWYQRRVNAEGRHLNVLGGTLMPTSALADVGLPILGDSWDEGIVAMLVAHFSSSDRLCLLTQNTRRDQNGLWRILHNEVRPELESANCPHLGLLVMVHNAKMPLATYATLVEHRLLTEGVPPGFKWEVVNAA